MKKFIVSILGKYINAAAHVLPGHAGALGFKLFCYPFRGPIKPYHKAFFDTAEQGEMHVNGNVIKTYRWNNGPRKILFLHGWQSHSFRWKNYIERFTDQYTLYALDAPGHGQSSGSQLTVPMYGRVIEEFVNQHGPFDAIVSHSLGSFTTLYVLAKTPSLPVRRVVLLASAGKVSDFFEFYKSTLGLSARAITQIKKYFASVIDEPLESFAATAYAKKMTLPGLLIHDEEDTETSSRYSVAFHDVWKNSKLIITKGLTHNLKSPEVVTTVVDFVSAKQAEEVH